MSDDGSRPDPRLLAKLVIDRLHALTDYDTVDHFIRWSDVPAIEEAWRRLVDKREDEIRASVSKQSRLLDQRGKLLIACELAVATLGDIGAGKDSSTMAALLEAIDAVNEYTP